MGKKYLCIGLCLLFIFSIAVPIFADTNLPSQLGASYVKFSDSEGGEAITSFPETGSKVYASTDITNNGDADKAAVLWVGVYKNEILTGIEYRYMMIPKGETYKFTTPAITIPTGSTSENTKIKAYIWDSFTSANALAPVANMLKDSGDLGYIRFNGNDLAGFNNETYIYTYKESEAGLQNLGIEAKAKDNATKVEISGYSYPQDEVTIYAIKSDGTKKIFTIRLKVKGKVLSLDKNPDIPRKNALAYNEELITYSDKALNVATYTDRTGGTSFYPLGHASEMLIGGALIRMPLQDVRCSTTETDMVTFMNTADQDYFTFTADTGGTIVALSNKTVSNYSSWKTLNNGTGFSVEYNGRTYTALDRYTDENGNSVTIPSTSSNEFLPYDVAPTNVYTVTRYKAGTDYSYVAYRYAYAKHFDANTEVSVPTVNNAAVSGSSEGMVYVIVWGKDITLGSDSYTNEQEICANISDKNDMTVDISDVIIFAEHAVGLASSLNE